MTFVKQFWKTEKALAKEEEARSKSAEALTQHYEDIRKRSAPIGIHAPIATPAWPIFSPHHTPESVMGIRIDTIMELRYFLAHLYPNVSEVSPEDIRNLISAIKNA